MNEREDILHCSADVLHRKSRSAATSQPGMSAVSNSFTFGIQERTTLPVSKEELAVMEASEAKAEWRRSFGTCFRSLNRGREGLVVG